MKAKGTKQIAVNRKARHEYFVEEAFEAGLELVGTEVKSLRNGTVNLKDSWCDVSSGELFVKNMHISPYEQGNRWNHEPLRTRKLLMHKQEIMKLLGKTKERGYTLIPLKAYFKRGLVKIDLGLATGKKLYDKRQDIAERDAKRDIDRAFRDRQKEC